METIFKAVLFDLDGVICHTDEYHYRAWKKLADELDIYFDEKRNRQFRGVSRMRCLELLLASGNKICSEEEKAALADRKNGYYRNFLKDLSKEDLSEEVEQTLYKLRERGYLLAISSSSKNTGVILKQLGLEGFFDCVTDGNDITKSKPSPEVFLKSASRLGVKPEECLVVEDAAAGIEAAAAGGMKSAGIGQAAECDKITYRINRLVDLLLIL